jgi:lysine 6-dehydrogenase
MKIMIAGSGLMGPAAVANTLSDPAVSEVTVCDVDPRKLEACVARHASGPGAGRLRARQIDLADAARTAELMGEHDAVVSALPLAATVLAMEGAMRAGVPIVDMARVPDAQFAALRERFRDARVPIVCGAGLEPGLTEIFARSLAEQLDTADELHIKCGGVPERPAPPLGYKIVFGGDAMPLKDTDGLEIRDGELVQVTRYSGVESVFFAGVGELEAWHEGFMPWMLEIPALQNLRTATQKTIRWPGYAAKVSVLKELGLLRMDPVEVDGVRVSPKRVVDAVLRPEVSMNDDDRDVTLFRVDVRGRRGGETVALRAEMIDRADAKSNFTSMARTTAFTAAIIGRMAAARVFSPKVTGVVTPERLIVGPWLERLVGDLGKAGIVFEIGRKTAKTVGKAKSSGP